MTRQIQSKWAPGFVILALLAGSSLAQAAPDSADDSAPCSTAKLSGTYGYPEDHNAELYLVSGRDPSRPQISRAPAARSAGYHNLPAGSATICQ